MADFAVRNITAKEKPKFEQLLLRMTISNGWSFRWTMDPATLEFFEFLNPNLVLPYRHTLSNPDRIGATLAFDGYKNVLNQHIFGSLFILSNGETLVWQAIDISSEQERMIEIIPKIESMINEAYNIGAKLSAIVSDSAPAYSALRNLDTTHKLPFDNPSSDNELGQSSSHLDALYLPRNITSILLNNDFWQKIRHLHILLLPYYQPAGPTEQDELEEDNESSDLDIETTENWENRLND
ncbi:25224_t:CDS:2 [Gigaspora rosea]|nr:25224_t:CDS:2 [Gigaspora rosea]